MNHDLSLDFELKRTATALIFTLIPCGVIAYVTPAVC